MACHMPGDSVHDRRICNRARKPMPRARSIAIGNAAKQKPHRVRAGLASWLCVARLARGYAGVAKRIRKPCAPCVVSDAIAALSFPHDHALMPCMRCHCRCYVYRLPFDHCPNPLIASDANGLGACLPRSQRDIVMPLTPNLSASCSCVRPRDSRALRSCWLVMLQAPAIPPLHHSKPYQSIHWRIERYSHGHRFPLPRDMLNQELYRVC